MRGGDWDKVRRNRKVWNSDYREGFKENLPVTGYHIKSYRKDHPKIADTVTTKFSQTRPKTAREISLHLVALGLKGKVLRETVNDLLTGKKHISWVEFDIHIKNLLNQGYEMASSELGEKTGKICFVKRNATGEVESEATFNFKKT